MATAWSSTAVTFNGSGVGAIADGTSSACPAPGTPLITFAAGRLTSGALTGHSRQHDLGPAHAWSGDITATLISPTGISFPLMFGRIGAVSATAVGASADLSGTYVFVDPAITTNNIWTAATNAPNPGYDPPRALYATTPVGGAGGQNPPTPSNFSGRVQQLDSCGSLTVRGTLQIVTTVPMTPGNFCCVANPGASAPPLQYSFAPTFISFPDDPGEYAELCLSGGRVRARDQQSEHRFPSECLRG